MNSQQAGLVIAELQAFFPRFPIPPSTAEVWSRELERVEFDDARRAIGKLATTWPDDHYPGLQAILAKVREVTASTMSPALPSAPVDAASREEMAAILGRFWEGRDGDRLDAALVGGHATPEARLARSRERAQQLIEESALPTCDREWTCRVLAKIGTAPIRRDGEWVCSACGEPLQSSQKTRSDATKGAPVGSDTQGVLAS